MAVEAVVVAFVACRAALVGPHHGAKGSPCATLVVLVEISECVGVGFM